MRETSPRRVSRGPLHPCALAAIALGGLLIAAGARGEAEETGGSILRGFEPSLMLGFGVHSQSLTGEQNADAFEIMPGRQSKLRFSFSEAEIALFSPTLTERLGLRLFVHGGGQLPFTDLHLSENSIDSVNNTRRNPDDQAAFDAQCSPFPPNVVDGSEAHPVFSNGFCEITSRNETILNGSLFAGLGLDLTLPLGSRQFHLRPSLNWYAKSVETRGETSRTTTGEGRTIRCDSRRHTFAGQRCNDETTNANGRDLLDIYRTDFTQTDAIFAKSDATWMHGFGPRLELDIEVAKVGNAIFEVFAQTAIYWILSDRTIESTGLGSTGDGTCSQRGLTEILVDRDTNPMIIPGPNFCSPTRPGGEPIRANYRSRVGATVVQGGMGFRVIWRGLPW